MKNLRGSVMTFGLFLLAIGGLWQVQRVTQWSVDPAGAAGHACGASYTDPDGDAPTNAIAYNGNCYIAFGYTAAWTTAQTQCAGLISDANSYLASITAAAENTQIDTLIGATDTWIGYNDRSVEDTFAWDSGDAVGYTNHDAGFSNSDLVDCAYMQAADGQWDIANCGETRAYACETTGCGNGVKYGSEACDDGNTTNGDGCSSDCAIETGIICTGDVGSQSTCTSAHGQGWHRTNGAQSGGSAGVDQNSATENDTTVGYGNLKELTTPATDPLSQRIEQLMNALYHEDTVNKQRAPDTRVVDTPSVQTKTPVVAKPNPAIVRKAERAGALAYNGRVFVNVYQTDWFAGALKKVLTSHITANGKLQFNSETRVKAGAATGLLSFTPRFSREEGHAAAPSAKVEAMIRGLERVDPNAPMTRGQFFALLLDTLNIDLIDGCQISYSDVPTTAWFADAICTLSHYGIIHGYQNGLMGPYDSITMAQIVATVAEAHERGFIMK
jgi:cysteine-rich repeat protein